jgi:hypothetical protein
VAFTRFEFNLTLEVNVPGTEQTLINIRVHGSYRHIQFRVIRKYLIGRLSLGNQRGDNLILFTEFMPRHADAGTGIAELISIFPVSEFGIVSIFVCNRTAVDLFITAVADIRSLVQTFTTFFLEIPAGLVTGRTGSAFDPAQDDLVAGIGLFAVVSVNTKVMGIVKRAFMIPVG